MNHAGAAAASLWLVWINVFFFLNQLGEKLDFPLLQNKITQTFDILNVETKYYKKIRVIIRLLLNSHTLGFLHFAFHQHYITDF